jgi:hypothetical protein
VNQAGRGPISTHIQAASRPPRPAASYLPRVIALACLLALLSTPLPVARSSGAVHAPFTPLLTWVGEGEQIGGEYGYSVAGAGDVDGDGYDDLLVGAARYERAVYREGIAMAFHGSPGGLNTWPIWITGGGQTGARYGSAVSPAGDVNGDGYADVLVGAHRYNANQSEEGRAYLFLGSAIGLGGLPVWTFDGGQPLAHLGFSVAAAGDVDGDGYDDVIVGARWYTRDYLNEGAAFIFYGSASGLAPLPDLVLTGGRTGATFGHAVAGAGDVNDDGYADVLVGAPQYANGEEEEGAAFLFYGSPAGLIATPGWSFEGDQLGAELGTSVASAGDLNGDGVGDAIVGAPLYDDVVQDVGAILVFLGSTQGLSTAPQQILDSDQANSSFGFSVAPLGDVTGDGHDDVVVGAPLFTHDQSAEGAVFIFSGSSAGLNSTPAWRVYGDKADTRFGHTVSPAGDVDGNGVNDLAIGAPDYRRNEDILGRAYLFQISVEELPFRLYVPVVLNAS